MALKKKKKNLEYYDNIKEEIQLKEDKKFKEAKITIEKIKNLKIDFSREADEKDQLYGSISKKEILSYLKENEISIHSDDIIINNPIRSLGEHSVIISPYLDISEKIIIKVNKN